MYYSKENFKLVSIQKSLTIIYITITILLQLYTNSFTERMLVQCLDRVAYYLDGAMATEKGKRPIL